MADFCEQCARDILGITSAAGNGDLATLTTPEQTAQGIYCRALCEGCGPTLVDHDGWCQGGCINPDHPFKGAQA